jgi:hypothetical protein
MYGASWWKVQSAFTVDSDDQIRLARRLPADREWMGRSSIFKSGIRELQHTVALRDHANDMIGTAGTSPAQGARLGNAGHQNPTSVVTFPTRRPT